MKSLLLKSLAGAGIVLFAASCNNNNPNSNGVQTGSTDTTATTMSTDVKTTTDTTAMKSANTNNGGVATMDNEFVTKASGGGMMEVELGKLAQTNAASQEVKDYGKMLETDHSKANAALQSIAAADNLNFPSAMPQEHVMHVDMLKAKTGAAFDQAYMTMMVEDHVKDIAEFKKAAKENSDEKVKAFAAKTLPVLEGHLAKARAIKSKLK